MSMAVQRSEPSLFGVNRDQSVLTGNGLLLSTCSNDSPAGIDLSVPLALSTYF
jgi:hypothetical protein